MVTQGHTPFPEQTISNIWSLQRHKCPAPSLQLGTMLNGCSRLQAPAWSSEASADTAVWPQLSLYPSLPTTHPHKSCYSENSLTKSPYTLTSISEPAFRGSQPRLANARMVQYSSIKMGARSWAPLPMVGEPGLHLAPVCTAAVKTLTSGEQRWYTSWRNEVGQVFRRQRGSRNFKDNRNGQLFLGTPEALEKDNKMLKVMSH